jgi:hypothetical protein
MIWICDFPLPPTVNQYLQPRVHSVVENKTGQVRLKAWQHKTDIHQEYENACNMWCIAHASFVQGVRNELISTMRKMEHERIPVSFRVDSWFCFHEPRIYAKDGTIKELDANNRVKPFLDALVRIFGVDDRHFFAGNCEKITTDEKDKECAIARITPFRPRTLSDIMALSGKTSPAF